MTPRAEVSSPRLLPKGRLPSLVFRRMSRVGCYCFVPFWDRWCVRDGPAGWSTCLLLSQKAFDLCITCARNTEFLHRSKGFIILKNLTLFLKRKDAIRGNVTFEVTYVTNNIMPFRLWHLLIPLGCRRFTNPSWASVLGTPILMEQLRRWGLTLTLTLQGHHFINLS